jgi:hypothetical protein
LRFCGRVCPSALSSIKLRAGAPLMPRVRI